MAQKILIIEDMEEIITVLRSYLEREGFQVVATTDGLQGLQAMADTRPDLVILDLILPGLDGLEICRRIRRDPDTAQIPILIISGKGEEGDRVVGLEVGGDDYVVKPFSPKELVARVRSLLRRAAGSVQPRVLRAGGIELDLDRYTVSVRDRPVALTAKEFELLKTLLEARGRALSRNHLYETIWGYQQEIESRTIDVHIRSLRQKLGSEGGRILTVRNVGYRLDPSLEVPGSQDTDTPSSGR